MTYMIIMFIFFIFNIKAYDFISLSFHKHELDIANTISPIQNKL